MCLSGRSHGPARIQTFMWGCEAALLSISTVCMCCMKTHTLPYILFHHRILPNKYFLNGSVGCTSIYLHSEIPHKIICNWSCNDSSSSSIIKNTHPVHPLMNPTHVCFLSKCASQQNVFGRNVSDKYLQTAAYNCKQTEQWREGGQNKRTVQVTLICSTLQV